MSKYYGLWERKNDIGYEEVRVLAEEEIVYAGYTDEDYSGSAIVVFLKDGKLYENHDSHCSCYGLDAWSPELTRKEAVLMRAEGWPGLAERLGLLEEAVVYRIPGPDKVDTLVDKVDIDAPVRKFRM
jgi:hypothetical protein